MLSRRRGSRLKMRGENRRTRHCVWQFVGEKDIRISRHVELRNINSRTKEYPEVLGLRGRNCEDCFK
jgi:hypothetical protein